MSWMFKSLAGLSAGGALAALFLSLAAVAAPAPHKPFFLKDGDRVCFYGDSITEQRFYPAEVQTYVLTRFPHLHVRYIDAAVGGDRVTGGWAGPIDLRLRRDVYPFHPNVVTIMLGMNDAGYQPFNPKLYNTFKTGYVHIIRQLKKHLPGVRIVLLLTSPYDELGFKGGYNAVLQRYDAYVSRLGRQFHLPVVDFNTPMNRILLEAYHQNPWGPAREFFPGRIHPSAAMEMIMAQQLLKAWGAPALVSGVKIHSGGSVRVIQSAATHISGLTRKNGALSWTQLDRSLPMPVLGLHAKWKQFLPWTIFLPPQPNPSYTNKAAALIDQLSGFTRQLDQERLAVTGLTAPQYNLLIDQKPIGTFTAAQLANGINLARYFTPMLLQAYQVQNLVWEEIEVHFEAWHGVQTTLGNFGWKKPNLPVTTENSPAAAQDVLDVVRDMGHLQSAIARREMIANQPHPHHYELVPIPVMPRPNLMARGLSK